MYKILGLTSDRTKFFIKTPFGICKSWKCHFRKGHLPTIRTAINKRQYWLNKVKKTHNYKYTYPNFEYKSCQEEVDIICPKHGLFKQLISTHTGGAGCMKCATNLRNQNNTKTQKEVIESFRKVHGSFYDYSKVEYKKGYKSVTIICPEHGEFQQKPNDHGSGKGCMLCGFDKIGYTKTKWKRCSPGNNAKVYVIKCWNENEEFYKIGRTVQTLKQRFKVDRNNDLPYFYEKVFFVESEDRDFIWELESTLKKELKQYRYTPKIKFGGYTECFNINSKKEIKCLLKKYSPKEK